MVKREVNTTDQYVIDDSTKWLYAEEKGVRVFGLYSTNDPEEIWHLKRRIAELTPMLTQMNELAELTAHYYDRGYYRSEKYTL